MSTTKHTPGPWVVKGRYIGTRYHMSAIGECRDVNGNWCDDAMACGNARLIAAAPDLLEACKTFVEWLRREDEGMPQEWRDKRGTPEGEAAWRQWFDGNVALCSLAQSQARAAIAKAEGKS